jgi:Caspase domain
MIEHMVVMKTWSSYGIIMTRASVTRLLLSLCLAIWITPPSRAEGGRVALVVGASNYAHAPALAHTLDDARDMAGALRRLGFDVDLVLDPDRANLENAVRRLGQKARGADASLFFYSGHAIESQGVNWIVPVSADVKSERDLRFEALDLGAVMEQTQGSARISLLFLDACRDDPFKQRLTATRDLPKGGLANVSGAVGTYVAFATAPGMVAEDGVGAHSPFTGAMLKYIETPGLEVRPLLSSVRRAVREATAGKQVPWDSSALEGDFYFNPKKADVIPESVSQPVTTTEPRFSRADQLFWESVRNSKNAADFNAYLIKFPGGVFAELARSRLAELESRPASQAAPGPDPNLLAALSIVFPASSSRWREEFATAYQARSEHKAIAGNVASGADQWVAQRSSAQEAQDNALEACEVYSGAPCVLVEVDGDAKQATGREDFSPHAMPRVHYAGPFDPERVPSVRRDVRQRNDVLGYSSAPSPKAAAYHPSGKLFIITGAAAQRAAEEQALSACNADPIRNGQGGPCYLYASNADVVLPRHSRVAITSAGISSASPASPDMTSASAPPAPRLPLKDAVLARLSATSGRAAGVIDGVVQSYLALEDGHKAIAAAALAPFTISSAAGLPTALEAGVTALERCQLVQRAPCALIAVDNVLPAVPADGKAPIRDMARVDFDGIFDPGMIPGLIPSDRARADVAGYLRAPAPKAAALAAGKITIVSGAASQFEAERQALAGCGTGCNLYAANSRVVLSQHRTEPRPHGKSLGDVLSYTWVSDEGPKLASSFVEAKAHKSLAMLPETGRPFSFYGVPSPDRAEELALEACELQFNAPCVAVAIDGKVLTLDPSSGARRTMPRITYQGPYRSEMVPLFYSPTKEMRDYTTLSEPKAMAIRAAGAKLKVGTGRTLAEAEAKALAQCNDDSPYPCILYAANERVVLPQRRTEPEP